MAIDTASPRSRRALLAAALGAGAATVASAIGRPLPVRAGDVGVLGVGEVVGVAGYVGRPSQPFPEAPTRTGVFGYSAKGTTSGRGVIGQSPAGHGVHGLTTTGVGVYATATDGYALRAVGRVRFDNCAGVSTIQAGKGSVRVTPGVNLTASSAVVATLQGSAGSATTAVSRVFINATNDTFDIHLTANATQDVRVAWHLFG